MQNCMVNTLAERFAAAMKARSTNPNRLAVTHSEQSTIQRIASGEILNPRLSTLDKYAKRLRVNLRWLMDGSGQMEEFDPVLNEPGPASSYLPTRTAGLIPVVGHAQLGPDGYWREMDYPAGWGDGFIRWHSEDPNAYAVRVFGDSMRPRIKPGEFVIIEPNHPASAGDEVLVRTRDGQSMVKVLNWRRGGMTELGSVNEDHRPITLPDEQIAVIHFVALIAKRFSHVQG